MKRRTVSVLVMGLFVILMLLQPAMMTRADQTEEREVSLLFFHDLHSYLDEQKDEEGTAGGGIARLKTRIDEVREQTDTSFLFDAGDFSMGTLYQTLYQTEAVEYVSLGRLGVDATCIGNHEFDYGPEGFGDMLLAAQTNAGEKGVTLPDILCANIDWNKNTSDENKYVQQAMERCGGRSTVIERNGIRIGVFGLFGKDAADCAPNSGFVFEDCIATAKEMVKKLSDEKVDMIVCLSHSGTAEQMRESEDERLAKAVPEIDVIVSAHTHTTLESPIVYDHTYIVSAGCYGKNLGEITLRQAGNKRWLCTEYQLTPMDHQIKPDEEIDKILQADHDQINARYLNQFGYQTGQILARNDVFLPMPEAEEMIPKENLLGNLIADSYIYAARQNEGDGYETIAMSITPSGIVRSDLPEGAVTVDDVFEICSLGIGPDRVAGYPLVTMYLTGKEIKLSAEVDASITPLMPAAQLYASGIEWTVNIHRPFLNKAIEVTLLTEEGKKEPLEDDRLYRIIGNSYTAQMMQTVSKTSYGLLKFQLKDKDGNPVENINDYILRDKEGHEIKEWEALASYLQSFPKEEGIPVVPEQYHQPMNRKIIQTDYNILHLLEKPNGFTLIYAGAFLLILLLLFALFQGIRRAVLRRRRKHGKERTDNKT